MHFQFENQAIPPKPNKHRVSRTKMAALFTTRQKRGTTVALGKEPRGKKFVACTNTYRSIALSQYSLLSIPIPYILWEHFLLFFGVCVWRLQKPGLSTPMTMENNKSTIST
jgi:hypothetical protein